MPFQDGRTLFARAFPEHQPDDASREWLDYVLRARKPSLGDPHVLLIEENERTCYAPFAGPRILHKEFAETPLTRDGIFNFVRKWGCLGVGCAIFRGRRSVYGEPLDLWVHELAALRLASQLWEGIKEFRHKRLSKIIRWRRKGVFLKWRIDGPEEPMILDKRLPDDLGRELLQLPEDEREPFTPALYFLHNLIEQAFRRFPVHLTTKTFDREWIEEEEPRILGDLLPGSLLSAIWLQMFQAVSRIRDYRRCQNCESWMEVSSQAGRRADVQFCKPSCRQRFHRQKRRRAYSLSQEGQTVPEIEAELGSSGDSVRRWIERKGR